MKLDFYDDNDLALIIKNNALKLDLDLSDKTLENIAKKSR
jgi:Holliday junction resolvasome RuvABC ATP-dependent DNA helicase subunit